MLLGLKLEEYKELKLKIEDSHSVITPSEEIIKHESTLYEIGLKANSKSSSERNFEALFENVKQKFVNIPKYDRDKFDKSLLNVKLRYNTNTDGEILDYNEPVKAYRRIRSNTKKIIEDGYNLGMQPQDEEWAEEFFEEVMIETYLNELFKLIKKYHFNYGKVFPIDAQKTLKGKFNRRLAKVNIPSTDTIKTTLNSNQNIYSYSMTREIDMIETMKIFDTKTNEEFGAFDKMKTKEAIQEKKWIFKREEKLLYEIKYGLITYYELKVTTKMSKNNVVDCIMFELN